MRRLLIAALLVIAIQGVGVALIAWWTREGPPATSHASAPPIEERVVATAPLRPLDAVPGEGSSAPVSVPPASAAEPAVAAAASGEPPPEPPSTAERRGPRSGRSLREGMPAETRHALRSFRREVKAGFDDLQKRVAPCAAADASFTLDVETVEGGIRIVDARVERSSARDASVACARSALLGAAIEAPSAEPGRRWQMSFVAR